MCARVDDAIHVQVEVIKLHLVWVGFSRIDRYPNSIALFRLKETQRENLNSLGLLNKSTRVNRLQSDL